MSERGYLSIGEVLALLKPEFSDLTISKIRFLESQGLLDPERTPSGYRKFYEPDVERLRWILLQQQENYLPLKVIKGKLGSDEDEPAAVNGNGNGVAPGSTETLAPVAVEVDPALYDPSVAAAAAADADTPSADAPSAVRRRGELRGRGTKAVTGTFPTSSASVSLTLDELSVASGMSPAQLTELERFGLVGGKPVAGTVYYDEDALAVAHLAAGFMRFGVEARHLRMYRTSAEREASFFEQVVMPMLKQRNPQARRQAVETLGQLAKLGAGLRAAMIRQALRDYTNP